VRACVCVCVRTCIQLEGLRDGTKTRAELRPLLVQIATRAQASCAAATAQAVEAEAELLSLASEAEQAEAEAGREIHGGGGLLLLSELAGWGGDAPADVQAVLRAACCLLGDTTATSGDVAGDAGGGGVAAAAPWAQPLGWATALVGGAGAVAAPHGGFFERMEVARRGCYTSPQQGGMGGGGGGGETSVVVIAQRVRRARACLSGGGGGFVAPPPLLAGSVAPSEGLGWQPRLQQQRSFRQRRNRCVALICGWVMAVLAFHDGQVLLGERAGISPPP
jgi:hypothetical protein